ncbi:helix-turn-helix domain-containing protein [Leifsonia sp. Le1]|uniref:TetR/AcrR family transcriptional regulator n=1 Tax=Leifsonia sp. Le1 TaxID=3404918 RepID=UPI003EB9A341
MARWEPDARGRLAVAALELYAERGYDRTTVADIAERAGVTERTFFRHFADKREVLFDGSNALQNATVAGIADAPADAAPLEIAGEALALASRILEDRRPFALLRAQVIAANTSLLERELLKMWALGAAAADALRARGVPAAEANLAAESAVTVFRAAFARWIAAEPGTTIDEYVRAALADLKALTATADTAATSSDASRRR